jgi:RNA polymerase sigma-70 factor (ECF subfamily)
LPDQTIYSDAKLLAHIQGGDEAAFETFFLRHYERVYGALYALLGNKADAEDMAQQVFFKLYQAPERLRLLPGEATNVAGWLYRVALNEGYNKLRSQKRRNFWLEQLGRLWPWSSHQFDPAYQAESQDKQAQVRQILLAMKPRQAQLLLLRYQGLSYTELAVALQVAPGSVGSLLTRAERVFREKYQQVFLGEE